MPKISELAAASSLAGTDTLCVVQSGTTKKATISLLTPSGTGLRKVVAGTEDAAASLLLNADVGAGAAIALSKIVNPTGTGLVKTSGGVIATAGALLVNADVDAAAAVSGSKVDPNFGAQNVTTTGYVAAGGATLPATGTYRMPDGGTIKGVVGGVDRPVISSSGGDVIIGDAAAVGSVISRALTNIYNQIGGDNLWTLNASGAQFGSSTFDYGGGVKVIGWDNATTVPTTNPTGGIVVYSEGGAWKVRGDGGAVHTTSAAGTGTTNTQNRILHRIQGTLRTTDATANQVVASYTPGNDSAFFVEATITGRNTAGSSAYTRKQLSGWRKDGATITQLTGSPNNLVTFNDTAFTGSGTTQINAAAIEAVVTGIAATTIDWQIELVFYEN